MSDEVLIKMSESLGRIEQKIDNNATALATHITHDEGVTKALFERIEKLQEGAAKQKGALTVLGALASMLGAAGGYVIEKLTFGHH